MEQKIIDIINEHRNHYLEKEERHALSPEHSYYLGASDALGEVLEEIDSLGYEVFERDKDIEEIEQIMTRKGAYKNISDVYEDMTRVYEKVDEIIITLNEVINKMKEVNNG